MDLPVFVINLRRATERRAAITKNLGALGLDFELVEAVDGRELTAEQLSQYSPRESMRISKRELTHGEIAGALSHLSVYRRMLDEGIEEALILEDDALPDTGFLTILENRHLLPRRWELVLLTHWWSKSMPWPRRRVTGPFHAVKFWRPVALACAYLLTRRGAEKLIRYSLPIRLAADGLTGRFRETRVRLWGIEPMVVVHGEFESDIQKEVYGEQGAEAIRQANREGRTAHR